MGYKIKVPNDIISIAEGKGFPKKRYGYGTDPYSFIEWIAKNKNITLKFVKNIKPNNTHTWSITIGHIHKITGKYIMFSVMEENNIMEFEDYVKALNYGLLQAVKLM